MEPPDWPSGGVRQPIAVPDGSAGSALLALTTCRAPDQTTPHSVQQYLQNYPSAPKFFNKIIQYSLLKNSKFLHFVLDF